MKSFHTLLFVLLIVPLVMVGQENVKTVGFQFKPLFPSSYFGSGPQNFTDSTFSYSLKPGSGYAAGMIIRKGYTKRLSLEFGLNYVVRNVGVTATHGAETASNKLRIVGYEIPFSQLIFIQLSERMFMNAGAGFCLNMYPSDVIKRDTTFSVYGGRKSIFNPSLLANIGFEYRTPKSGYIYIGASLNRPFSQAYGISIDYLNKGIVQNSVLTGLNGSYLSLDLKYFFHENPEKKRVKKTRPPAEKK